MATRKGPLPHPTAGQAHRSDEEKVATRKGLEPSTSGVTGRRSNQLNYRARQFRGIQGGQNGGNNRARTCDPMLVRHVLYQLSYAPQWAA